MSFIRAIRPVADSQWPITAFNADCAATEALFVRNFSGFDCIVVPSGSCFDHVRDNFDAIEQTLEVKAVRARIFEIVEFLHDIQKADAFAWAIPASRRAAR
jgi:L-lactate dehydrogenase complex protein LldE